MEEQVRTNIALQLGERKFNTVLVDISPEFTGEINEDGRNITKIVN